jgi:hypothetical protein
MTHWLLSWGPTRLCHEADCFLPKGLPQAKTGERKANELDSSDPCGSLNLLLGFQRSNHWVEERHGGHRRRHFALPATPCKLSGSLKPTAKGTGTPSVPDTSKRAAHRHTSLGPIMSDMPAGTIPSSAQIDKEVTLPEERRNKIPTHLTQVMNTR